MIDEIETMETTPEEVAAIVTDTDLYLMLPKKGYILSELFRAISADINTHYVSAMRIHYEGNKRLEWLIERIHSELVYYSPHSVVDKDVILASAGF